MEINHGEVIRFEGEADEVFFLIAGDFERVGFAAVLQPGVLECGPVVTAAPAGGAVGHFHIAQFVELLPLPLDQLPRVFEPPGQQQGNGGDEGKQNQNKDKAHACHCALHSSMFCMFCNHSVAGDIIFYMKELILLRHGESQWNAENRFTGWADVPLSVRGRREAELAGRRLRESGFTCREASCSLLMRAIHTLNIVLAGLDCAWVPVHKDWRLNEKHYGALQGRNKSEVESEAGEDAVQRWRRAYDCPPPPLPSGDERLLVQAERYAALPAVPLLQTESLKDTHRRVRACWEEALRPRLYESGSLLVVAHGNSLRALLMHLRGLSPAGVEQLEVPTAQPIRLQFDDDMKLQS